MVASAAAMSNLLNGLWFDGELYNFHRLFHIDVLILQLRGASFILRLEKVWFYCAMKLKWSWFSFVYMASFLDPRPAVVGDLVQRKLL